MRRVLFLTVIITLAAATAAQTKVRGPRAAEQKSNTGPASTSSRSSAAGKQSLIQSTGKAGVDCGCDGQAPPDVLATVNGLSIRTREVDKELNEEIDSLRNQVIEARRNELTLQINSRLLETEARRLAMTSERLLEQEVVSKAKEPTETEIKIYYDDNKERIQADYAEAKPHIARYLLGQRQQAQAKKLADRLRAAADLKVLVSEPTPPRNEADRDRLFATVNGQPVKSAHIEDAIATLIFSFQQRVYDMRKTRLESMINSKLLDQEARKRRLTSLTLLEMETSKLANALTEQDAKKFYEENRSRITGDYAALKDQLLTFIREQERRKAEAELADRLRKAAEVKVFLEPPEPPAFALSNENQPRKGNADAPVTIVEFTDFECGTCARTQPALEDLLVEYQGKVNLVVRDFPLENHKNAGKAAEAAEAARAQGKYWEYAALLFNNQTALDVPSLKSYAEQLGLDRARFDSELDSGKYFDPVSRDRQVGLLLGVDATPTLFVNGRRVRSIAKEDLKDAIATALRIHEESLKKMDSGLSRP
ncbi:MAG TPA: thioredoxin domain-containing protein [Blastocatellia bacterium]|nr:thioredoxin domain-containing protein [Blastocatellia bacterium]